MAERPGLVWEVYVKGAKDPMLFGITFEAMKEIVDKDTTGTYFGENNFSGARYPKGRATE